MIFSRPNSTAAAQSATIASSPSGNWSQRVGSASNPAAFMAAIQCCAQNLCPSKRGNLTVSLVLSRPGTQSRSALFHRILALRQVGQRMPGQSRKRRGSAPAAPVAGNPSRYLRNRNTRPQAPANPDPITGILIIRITRTTIPITRTECSARSSRLGLFAQPPAWAQV
jgi:hypothetical protein